MSHDTPAARTPQKAASYDGRVLIRAEASGFSRITAAEAALLLSAEFGDLLIPYERISRLTLNVTGSIELHAGGAVLCLETDRTTAAPVLFSLLEKRIAAHRRRFVSRDDTRG